MRALTVDEYDGLQFVSVPSTVDAGTPEGARLDAAMVALIDRGCVTWRRYEGGCSFGLTYLGALALRVHAAVAS